MDSYVFEEDFDQGEFCKYCGRAVPETEEEGIIYVREGIQNVPICKGCYNIVHRKQRGNRLPPKGGISAEQKQ